ncbi:MAG: 50S ribosomal protein L6 [Bdellovibrionales bacterium]|nr:50S ribosomal protein L6 [Bdellovibrionales bacterium]NQZ17693.1 50S ribosomal protein L6 [Bdellovibrionales bacterium]
MSRIGKYPVEFDSKVNVSVTENNEVVVKGGKTTLTVPMLPEVKARVEDGKVYIERQEDTKKGRSLHGLYRSLVQNAVTGVTTGFTKSLILNGVGYRASVSGKTLELSLGYSHPIKFPIPEGIEAKVEKQTTVHISGASKEQVGQVAAKIRGFREPEPFLGKGVRYSDEVIRRKEGKSAGK